MIGSVGSLNTSSMVSICNNKVPEAQPRHLDSESASPSSEQNSPVTAEPPVLGTIRAHIGETLTEDNAVYDVNGNGVINAQDMLARLAMETSVPSASPSSEQNSPVTAEPPALGAIRAHIGETLTEDNAVYDINGNSVINAQDMLARLAMRNQYHRP